MQLINVGLDLLRYIAVVLSFNFQNSKKIHKNVFSENILLFGQHINEIT